MMMAWIGWWRYLLLLLPSSLLGENRGATVFAVASYIPGINHRSFRPGDRVPVQVNKLTSHKTLLPLPYRSLPFCPPVDGPSKLDHLNLGEILAGDRIESSPYQLFMKREMYCEQLCIMQITDRVVQAIRQGYRMNLMVDNLPSTHRLYEFGRNQHHHPDYPPHWHIFQLGFVSFGKEYIYNHVNLEIMYHPVQEHNNTYRIVRFAVHPRCIQHEFLVRESYRFNEDKQYHRASIQNPIASCKPGSQNHTTENMLVERDLQPASDYVLFTYDVTWIANHEVPWASRWDFYMVSVPVHVHWMRIGVSVIWLVLLTSVVVAILVRHLRRDMDPYNRLEVLDNSKKQQEQQETDTSDGNDDQLYGWRSLHADVFRPPSHPLILAVACGTGAQILCTSLGTSFLGIFGLLSPARRGQLLMTALLLFASLRCIGGYVTARLYMAFRGYQYERATMWTALGFPSLVFCVFLVVNIMAKMHESTLAVSYSNIGLLLFFWFGISTTLVFVGARFGYRQESFEFPLSTNYSRRPIPYQPWFLGVPCTMMVAGILPFASSSVEIYYMMASALSDFYYYAFGFLMCVFVIVLVTSAQVTILFNYFQLCREDYHWWWRSFANAGSRAIYVCLYSIGQYQESRAAEWTSLVIFFGYMIVVCVGLFCMLGFIGVTASLSFNRAIYASLRQELQAEATESGASWGQNNDLETTADDGTAVALRKRTTQSPEESDE